MPGELYQQVQLQVEMSGSGATVNGKTYEHSWLNQIDQSTLNHILDVNASLESNFDPEKHRHLGELLFTHFIGPENFIQLQRIRRQFDRKLLIQLFARDAHIIVLPWETLFNGESYLNHGADFQVERLFPLSTGGALRVKSSPLRVLVTMAAPDASHQTRYLEEIRSLNRFAENIPGLLNLIIFKEITIAKLYNTLVQHQKRGQAFQVWYHLGAAGKAGLQFGGDVLSWSDTNNLLARFEAMRIVTFDLHFKDGSSPQIYQALHNLPVPLIGGFIRNSNPFSRTGVWPEFYKQLVQTDVYEAVHQARQHMIIQDVGHMDWRSFLVVHRTKDLYVFSPQKKHTTFSGGMMSDRNQVFISYSHADSIWLEKLRVQLKPLERQGLIKVWADTDIETGSQWFDDIQTALEKARVAVLLVSPNFLGSDFIAENELPPILEASMKDGLRIFWIPVSSSIFQTTPIKNYQAAHNPAKPLDMLTDGEVNQVLSKIALQINDVLSKP